MKRFILLSVLIFWYSGCSHTKQTSSQDESICLVLSVGAAKGFAHIGAIDALKELNVEIDYVYGNSAGALVGGIYSANPKSDLIKVTNKLFSEYRKETENAKKEGLASGATSGLLFGTILAFVTGGVLGWETILASGASGYFSYKDIENLDFDRVQNVLNKYFKNQSIEDLPIMFATSYQDLTKTGNPIETVSTGNLASAICNSMNNPMIFKRPVKQINYLDPGLDRMAATPIYDAIQHFKPTKIIAINVTGEKATYHDSDKIEIVEIMAYPIGNLQEDNLKALPQLIRKNYEIGYNVVMNNFSN